MENKPNQIKELRQLVGKTIEKAFDSNDKIFLFLSGNYFALFTATGYDNCCELEESDYKLVPTVYNARELARMGVLSKEDAEKIVGSYQEEQRNQIKEAEIKRLKELKEKYPEV